MSEVKPIYLYRRKGQPAWATCDAERYDELRRAVHLFDTGTAYSASDYDALAAEFNDPEYPPKHSRRLIEQLRTERDAALAELAALKGGQEAGGGQEAVAMIRYARGVPGFENEMPHVVSCNDLPDGLYPVYLAPPAQASAWPEGAARSDTWLEKWARDKFTSTGRYKGRVYGNTDWALARALHTAMLAAAPTPGASDGKGGDHSAHDLNMVQVPKDLHLITLGMLSSYVTTLAGIDFPDNDEGDHQQRLNETKRAAVNSAIAKLRALITGSTA